MRLSIVDTGVGNAKSVGNMLRRARATGTVEVLITDRQEDFRASDGFILPGVGSFDAAMERLQEKGLIEPLHEIASAGIPVMGLCLGMQLMLEGSEEGDKPGLGWIPGVCKRLPHAGPRGEKLRVPHMGWNIVTPPEDDVIYPTGFDELRYYFDHSFAALEQSVDTIYGTTVYGRSFAAGVRKDHLFGFQFHPERSHRFGLGMFERFIAYVGACRSDHG